MEEARAVSLFFFHRPKAAKFLKSRRSIGRNTFFVNRNTAVTTVLQVGPDQMQMQVEASQFPACSENNAP